MTKTKSGLEDLLQNIEFDALNSPLNAQSVVLPHTKPQKKTSTTTKTATPKITKIAPKEKNEIAENITQTPTKKAVSNIGTTTTSSVSRKNQTTAPDLPAVADIFMSGFMKSVVLFLIVAFNVVLLKNCFLMTISTRQNFSGNVELDAFLYGLAISMLMTIVLFHEENWQNGFCAGAMTLYINLLLLMLYIGFFEGILGVGGSVWAMSGLVVLLPVIGLFVMVIMLKNK